MRCPSCHHENRAGRSFCGECGVALAVACAACGASNEPIEKFCGDCGMPLRRVASAIAGAAASRQPDTAALPVGERRQLTVLFCDLVGSTPLSQQLDPEDWRDVVTRYHATARAVVERFGGYVAQLQGDGLLVYFGWPSAREDDPERAIRAALAIVDAMVPLNAELALPDGKRLAVRVGMHTGPVVVADGGAIFGETPNVAARVQSAADPETVAITEATQRLTAGMFVVEERGPRALKGVREPVVLYRVVQSSGVRSRLDVATGRLTPFVGREVELATLVERWERAQDGDGQHVLVVGEAGVGKSRLVYQFRERLAAVPHTWLECGATPYTESTPFHPVVALVAQGLAFTADDTPADKLAKIERGLRMLASRENVAIVADFLGLQAPTPLALNPDVQRRQTLELLARWTLAMSGIQPLVVLFEDVHWCDASSIELLARLVAQSATARVLVIATARPEFTSPWPARENVTTLQLSRLTKRQARDMVAALGGTALPADTLDALVTRADGMPLYVEELTKAVVEPGVAGTVEAIPATLADSLMARLDRLSTAKEVAQQAAVLGREFSYAVLAAVGGMEEAALRHGLARLVDAEILYRRGEPPAAVYTFKHALVQEAAYGSLLKRTRHELHGRVVDALVARFPERIAAEPEVVARHAELAGRTEEAITFYERAGEQAQAGSAHAEAISHFVKTIALLETQPISAERDRHELTLQLALASSFSASLGFGRSEMGAAYERAQVLAESTGDAARLGVARIGLSGFAFNRGQVERGRALADAVLMAAERRHDADQTLMACSTIAMPEFYQGRFASSLTHCERALALYEPTRHHGLVRVVAGDQGVAALSFAAWNLCQLGRLDTALARAVEAVALAKQLASPFNVGYALFFETVVHWWRRDPGRQRARAADVIALSEAQGFPLWRGAGHTFHGSARVAAGDLDGLREIMDGIAISAETGNQGGVPGVLMVVAEAQQAAGECAAARETIATALAISLHTGQRFFDADLHRIDGDLLLAADGAAEEAATRYHRALAIAREQSARAFELRAATSLARLWRDQGKRAEARDLLAPVYGRFTEGFATRDLIDTKALLDELA
jgi:class 3 adenylate cyclase/tetratricopeptide (TPR) repeat protein